MKLILILFSILFSLSSFAEELTIHGAEFGVGKFHRKGNKLNPYGKLHAWKPYVLPEGVPTKVAHVMKNSENDYTIFFTHLEEFLTKIVELTKTTGKKVSVLNINAHGVPGGVWFPRNAEFRRSMECSQWISATENSDDENYKQYYSAISKEQMLSYEVMSNSASIPGFTCLTGLKEWKQIVNVVPEIKNVFTSNAQVHMLSCIVGMGTLGESYTTGLAKLLFLNPASQQVQTAMKFGLGDWSMAEGMGFWGYESDAQLARDNSIYPIHKRDSEIAQNGNIRVAQIEENKIKSGFIKNERFMLMTHDSRVVDFSKTNAVYPKTKLTLPETIKLPHTNFKIRLK